MRALLLFLLLLVTAPTLAQESTAANQCWMQDANIVAPADAVQINSNNHTCTFYPNPGGTKYYQVSGDLCWKKPTGSNTCWFSTHTRTKYTFSTSCPANAPYTITSQGPPKLGDCVSNQCLDAPPKSGYAEMPNGGASICIGACAYSLRDGGGGNLADNTTAWGNGTWVSLERACSSGDSNQFVVAQENQDSCRQSSTLTQCYDTATKKTCVKSSHGTNFCWDPNETGTKASFDQDEAMKKTQPGKTSPDPNGLTQADSISNNSKTTNADGSSTSTTDTYTYYNSTGVPGTEEGNNGVPEGQEGGSEDGDGNCEAGEDCTNAGEPGEGVGDGLYNESGKTIGGIIDAHIDAVLDTPIVSAALGFIGAECGLHGNCPIFSWTAGEYFTVASDMFCTPTADWLLAAASWILLAMACYRAFTVAIDF